MGNRNLVPNSQLIRKLKRFKEGQFFLACITVFHLVFSPFFFIIGVVPLGIYNIAGFFMYAIFLNFYKESFSHKYLLFTALEVPLYSTIVALLWGTKTGVVFFPFAVIVGVFLSAINEDRPVYQYFLLALPSFMSVVFLIFWDGNIVDITNPTRATALLFHKTVSVFLSLAFMVIICFLRQRELLISKKKNADYVATLKYISEHDPLTQIANRRFLLHYIKSLDVYTLAQIGRAHV